MFYTISMLTLTQVLNNTAAYELEHVIAQKQTSPVLESLCDPEKAMRFLRTNLCASYLFEKYSMPTYASKVFYSLTQMRPADDTLGKILSGIAGMIQGELFNNNVYQRPGECHSHYYDMLEAYTSAGGSIEEMNTFTNLEKRVGFLEATKQSSLWTAGSKTYARTVFECYEDTLALFILLPVTEQITPSVYPRALKYLSADSRFDKFRIFLQRHVELDNDEHGPSTLQWLNAYIQEMQPSADVIEQATRKVLSVISGGKK